MGRTRETPCGMCSALVAAAALAAAPHAAVAQTCTSHASCLTNFYCDAGMSDPGPSCYTCTYITPTTCDAFDGDCCGPTFLVQCPTNPAQCWCDGHGGLTQTDPCDEPDNAQAALCWANDRGRAHGWDPTCRSSPPTPLLVDASSCYHCSAAQVCAAMRASPSESRVQLHGISALGGLAHNEASAPDGDVVREAGGIPLITGAMARFPDDGYLQSSGCDALRSLAEGNEANQAAIRAANGIEVASAVLSARFSGSYWNCPAGFSHCRRDQGGVSPIIHESCRLFLITLDPPPYWPYFLAACLSALAAVALCVQTKRRKGELTRCTPAGLGAALLLNLGCGAVTISGINNGTGFHRVLDQAPYHGSSIEKGALIGTCFGFSLLTLAIFWVGGLDRQPPTCCCKRNSNKCSWAGAILVSVGTFVALLWFIIFTINKPGSRSSTAMTAASMSVWLVCSYAAALLLAFLREAWTTRKKKLAATKESSLRDGLLIEAHDNPAGGAMS